MTRRLAAAALLVAAVAAAQEPKAALSPRRTLEAVVNGKKILIKYGAPSRRGRVVMGGLVPYGKVWRTGAGAATTLIAGSAMMVGTVHVPPGSYTLYTIPEERQWTLIINRQTGQSGASYDRSRDLGRVTMNVRRTSAPVETFRIDLQPTAGRNGLLTFTWENTEASVPVVVH